MSCASSIVFLESVQAICRAAHNYKLVAVWPRSLLSKHADETISENTMRPADASLFFPLSLSCGGTSVDHAGGA